MFVISTEEQLVNSERHTRGFVQTYFDLYLHIFDNSCNIGKW